MMILSSYVTLFYLFFFNDTATTEIYTLSLHDALPICIHCRSGSLANCGLRVPSTSVLSLLDLKLPKVEDRKSTRLNSSHSQISYAVFCLKKKKKEYYPHETSSHSRLNTTIQLNSTTSR